MHLCSPLLTAKRVCLRHGRACLQEAERLELAEFTAAEHLLLTEAQAALAAGAAQARADAGAAAAQLAEIRQRLVDTDAALLQRDDEVRRSQGCTKVCRAGLHRLVATQLTAASKSHVLFGTSALLVKSRVERQASAGGAEHQLSYSTCPVEGLHLPCA